MAAARSPISIAEGAAARICARIAAGVLGAGIVVGHDRDVGAARGDFAHDRPLARIAVAAATEHQHETPAHEGPERGDRLLERVGLMRVIDKDRRAADVADALEAPRRAFQRLQRLEHRIRLAARRDAKAGGDQRVGDLKVSGQRKVHAKASAAELKIERRRQSLARGGVEADRLALHADRDGVEPARPRRRDHARSDGAVSVDDRRRPIRQKLQEQPELGGQIILDRRMIVHVVARQIGECGGGEPHAVQPLLVETMRGGLDREVGDAVRGQPIEQLMQRDRVRRRQRSVDSERARHDADRSDRSGLPPQRPPDLAHESDDRSFPAGAGHRDNGFGLARIEARGGVSERGAGVGDVHEGGVGGVRPALGDNRGGAFRHRLAHVPEAVVLGAGKREEDIARRGLSTVERQARNRAIAKRAIGVLELEDVAKPSHRP